MELRKVGKNMFRETRESKGDADTRQEMWSGGDRRPRQGHQQSWECIGEAEVRS